MAARSAREHVNLRDPQSKLRVAKKVRMWSSHAAKNRMDPAKFCQKTGLTRQQFDRILKSPTAYLQKAEEGVRLAAFAKRKKRQIDVDKSATRARPCSANKTVENLKIMRTSSRSVHRTLDTVRQARTMRSRKQREKNREAANDLLRRYELPPEHPEHVHMTPAREYY